MEPRWGSGTLTLEATGEAGGESNPSVEVDAPSDREERLAVDREVGRASES